MIAHDDPPVPDAPEILQTEPRADETIRLRQGAVPRAVQDDRHARVRSVGAGHPRGPEGLDDFQPVSAREGDGHRGFSCGQRRQIPGRRRAPEVAHGCAWQRHAFEGDPHTDVHIADRFVSGPIDGSHPERMRPRHEVGRLVEEREGLLVSDFDGDPVHAEDDGRQSTIVMGPGLDDRETADQVSLGRSNQFEDRRRPVHDHGNLLADPGDELARIHRLNDHPQPMSSLGPVVGRPSDGEIATRSALGA